MTGGVSNDLSGQGVGGCRESLPIFRWVFIQGEAVSRIFLNGPSGGEFFEGDPVGIGLAGNGEAKVADFGSALADATLDFAGDN